MKKKVYKSLGLLSVLTIITAFHSCRPKEWADEKTRVYLHFPQEVRLEGEGYVVEEALMRYPFRIRQVGDYVYILDLHGADHFCHIFSKEDMSTVASFAARGNGPQEVIQALSMEVCGADSIWVFDTNKCELGRWSYSVVEDSVVLKESIKVENRLSHSAHWTYANDSLFFFTDRTGENRVLKSNVRGEIVEKIGGIPASKKVDGVGKATLAQAWKSYINYHPGKQLLAVATQLGDVIEIYNLKEGTRKTLYGPHGDPQYMVVSNGWAAPTGIMGYSDIQVTDRYIYAVFHGRTFKEIAQDPEGTPDGGEYIHVYTHEGVPVCRMTLDHAIYGIDVDEEAGIVWATDVNTEEQIVKYRLPNIKQEEN